MKSKILMLLAIAAGSAASVSATLISDQVTLRHYLPSTNVWFNSYGSKEVVVASDGSDAQQLGGKYSVDMNAFGFEVDFLDATTWAPLSFNGLGVTDMDWSGLGPGGILGVTISTNLVGWSDSRFFYDGSSAFANWSGLSFTQNSFFDVVFDVDTAPASSVPDTGATAAMLGLGVFGLAVARRSSGAQRQS